MKHIFINLLLISFLFFSVSGFSQKDEEDFKDAVKAFNHEYYEDAFEIFSKLIKLSPENPSYNFWYGASLLETDRSNPEVFFEHLQFAVNQKCKEPLLPYYYGYALQQNFRFEDALVTFKDFRDNYADNKRQVNNAEEKIAQCNIALNLPQRNIFEALLFKEKIKLHNLYRYYQSFSFSGNITLVPHSLESYKDQKSGELFFAYVTPEKDKIFFASYENEKHKDIYFAKISNNGSYSEPVKLSEIINTKDEESFPVFNSEENKLYFSSTGHNGIGGADIFYSQYFPDTDEWGEPVNLGYPINSIFDDYLFIRDINEKSQAFFCSNRYNISEDITLFTILTKEEDAPITIKVKKEAEDVSENVIIEDQPITDNNENKDTELDVANDINIQEKAQQKIWEKERANNITDSAFACIELYQNKIDNLNALINRTNIVSNTQNTKSKALFTQFFRESRENISKSNISSINLITNNLNNLEEDAIACRLRSEQSKNIGKQINSQVILSKQIFESLKEKGADIQLSAAQDPLKDVEILFEDFQIYFQSIDTLKSYNEQVDLIAYDKSVVNIPESKTVDVNEYLKNKVFIHQNIDKVPSQDQNNFDFHLSEGNNLMTMAINSYEKACSGIATDKYEYIISDAKTFSEKAIQEQQNAISLFDQQIAIVNNIDVNKEPIIEEPEEVIEAFPTPINKTSSDLIYKIQLGAFGQKVDQSSFSGIDNISTEAVTGTSLVRYFSGEFNSLELAENTLPSMSAKFPGAFIVAYKDGKKVSLSEIDKTPVVLTEKEPISTQDEIDKIPTENISFDVTKNDEKRYYIQLGTFSQTKSSTDLYEVSPLFFEKLNNGMTRYFAGSYKTEEEAALNLIDIKSRGAQNAFIVLYEFGEKQHIEVITKSQTKKEVKPVVKVASGEIIFKVQLGAYSKKKTSAWKKEKSQITGSAIDEFQVSNGIHIYATGSFINYESADVFKNQLINKGMEGVFVAAFQNGKKIPLQQAINASQK